MTSLSFLKIHTMNVMRSPSQLIIHHEKHMTLKTKEGEILDLKKKGVNWYIVTTIDNIEHWCPLDHFLYQRLNN